MSPRSIYFPFEEFHPIATGGAASEPWSLGSELLIFHARNRTGMHKPQRLSNSLRRKESPEKRTIPKKVPHCNNILGERRKRSDEGMIGRQPPEQWNIILFDRRSVNPLTADMKFRGTSLYLSVSLTICNLRSASKWSTVRERPCL